MKELSPLALDKEVTKKQKCQQWEAIIKDYGKSCLTQRAFCEERGIKYHNFSYHLSEYRRRQSKKSDVSFVPVKFSQENTPQATLSLSFPNGYSLTFPHSLPAKQLGALLSEIRKIGC